MKKPRPLTKVAVLCAVCAILAGLYFALTNKDSISDSKSTVASAGTTQEIKNAITLSDQGSQIAESKSIENEAQEKNIDYAALPLSDNAPESDTPIIKTPTGKAVVVLQPTRPIERFAKKQYQEIGYGDDITPYYSGTKSSAYVHLPSSGSKVRLDPNQGGEFQKVYVDSSDEVEVRIDFAGANNVTDNALYAVVAHDGGILENGAPSGLLRLDELRELAFRFYASPNNGTHRVTITSQSGETQKLDFWVGDEVTFAQE